MRDMVDAIQRSDLIVFIAPQIPPSDLVWGELHFAATAPGVRYLRVRVRQDVSRAQLVGLLAHELQHATEVAAAPDVVDTKTLDDLYDRIGFELSRGQHETDAARAVGDRVRREVSEYNEGLSRKY